MIPFDEPVAIGAPTLTLGPEIVRTALTLQARGWEIALASGGFSVASPERVLAGHLKTGMAAALRELGISAIVAEAVGTRSLGEPPDPDGEADLALWFYASFDHNDPHLIIECKRIDESDSYLIREYVNEGIDRFLKGHYRPGENGCFMTGFVLGGTAEQVVERINRYLHRKGRLGCELSLDPSLQDLGSIFNSDHAVAGLVPIANVKHAFLLVTTSTARPGGDAH